MLDRKELTRKEGREIILYTFFWSAALLLMVPLACHLSGERWESLGYNLRSILLSPSRLVTDYFELGSAGAAFINAGLCGLACSFAMVFADAKPTPTLLAGYFLVIAHCFYGLNFVNMWLPFLSIPLYCYVTKKPYREWIHLSFFCTSLGPFISDFLFRYTITDTYFSYYKIITVPGVLIAVAFSAAAGFIVPALLPGTTKMHRGFNLYKAGLAIGLFGIFAFAFFYKTFGIAAPTVIERYNYIYELNSRSYLMMGNIFFLTLFGLTFLFGFIRNGRTMAGYKELLDSDGLNDNFPLQFGMPKTYMNIGLYGMGVLLYYNGIIFFTEGAGFTGPTIGVIIAAVTFSACGQTIKNVWPIAVGYMILIGGVAVTCMALHMEIPSTISHQGYINGMAFATGLCPFVGRYGRRYGIIAGILNAILCTSTSAMHGGLVLYNGGLAAGLTAMLMIPILDFYNVPEKKNLPEE